MVFCAILGVLAGCASDPYRGWSEVRSAEHKFKLKMPAPPNEDQKKMPDGRQVAVWDLEDGIGKGGGGFNVNAGPTPIPEAVDTKTAFDLARDGLLQKFKGKLVKEADFVRQEKTIGRRVEMELPELRQKGIIVLVFANGIGYQLTVMGSPSWNGWKKADRFFDSFDLLP